MKEEQEEQEQEQDYKDVEARARAAFKKYRNFRAKNIDFRARKVSTNFEPFNLSRFQAFQPFGFDPLLALIV